MKRPVTHCLLAVRLAFLACNLSSCFASQQPGVGELHPLIPQFTVVQGPVQLSPYNRNRTDEDPTLIRSHDGRYVLCWFSNRNGNDNLYIRNSADGLSWNPPIQVTATKNRDFYPSLFQDAQGRFHLAWFRVSKSPPFLRHIWYTHSDDGIHWDPRSEVQVTQGFGSDWAPSIWRDSHGKLLIYFASKRSGDASREIYVTQSMDGIHWSNPLKPAGINDPKEFDDYPYVVQQQDGQFLMAWTRYPKSLMAFNGKMDILLSTSADGLNWQSPVPVTNDDAQGITDVLPFLYAQHSGDWAVGWVSTRTNPHGDVLSVPVSQIAAVDSHASLLIHGHGGYSPRAVATDTPGVYLIVWITVADKARVLVSQWVRANH